MDADRVTLMQNLPLGTVLVCTSRDIAHSSSSPNDVEIGDLCVIVSQTSYSTTMLCLTQGFYFEANYGRHSPYAKMCCYAVYET